MVEGIVNLLSKPQKHKQYPKHIDSNRLTKRRIFLPERSYVFIKKETITTEEQKFSDLDIELPSYIRRWRSADDLTTDDDLYFRNKSWFTVSTGSRRHWERSRLDLVFTIPDTKISMRSDKSHLHHYKQIFEDLGRYVPPEKSEEVFPEKPERIKPDYPRLKLLFRRKDRYAQA